MPVALVHHALLAVILCPMNGEKRRTGKVVFQPDLEGQLGSYQDTLKEVGLRSCWGPAEPCSELALCRMFVANGFYFYLVHYLEA